MCCGCYNSIQRNRERLLALGLPGIMKQLQNTVQHEKHPESIENKKTKKKKKALVKREEDENLEPRTGLRRSRRLQEAAERPPAVEETAEQRFDRELGEFIVNGVCPRCGRVIEKNHRAHLLSCSGEAKPSRSVPGYSAMDRELLAGLTEEEKKDSKKRTLARMKALDMSGLIDYTPEYAKFLVIGSKGDPYTVTLSDEKHKCTCLDHRFRRHNCKHILLVLSLLGTLEDPSAWRPAVENKLDELMAESKVHEDDEEHGPPTAAPPRNKDAEMAMKFV